MTRTLHPEEGARFLLERIAVEQGGGAARYRGAVYTPDAAFEYEIAMRAGGEVSAAVRPGGPAAPAELEDKLLAHARTAARAAERKRRDGLPPWPHRVLRWRGPGRG
ncbi:MAG TPA: hypothetical protein VKZ63_11150 [Kofleriaceae bacterium]|nr:hypothetical protein [Kofleriaceae bacterium]